MEFNDKEEIDIRSVIEFLKSDNNDLNFIRIPILKYQQKSFFLLPNLTLKKMMKKD